jgi:hypothetical protein
MLEHFNVNGSSATSLKGFLDRPMRKKQFKNRVEELLREELTREECWFYISFADETFKGCVIIKAHGITDALMKTHALNINPGGQVLAVPIPDTLTLPDESDRNRLLNREDVKRIWPDAKSIKEHRQDEHS